MLLPTNTFFSSVLPLQPCHISREHNAQWTKMMWFHGHAPSIQYHEMHQTVNPDFSLDQIPHETEAGWVKRNLCQGFSKCWINITLWFKIHLLIQLSSAFSSDLVQGTVKHQNALISFCGEISILRGLQSPLDNAMANLTQCWQNPSFTQEAGPEGSSNQRF